jgi:membrane protein implicated in regulation of membrane protease activity
MTRRKFWTLISVALSLMVTAIALPFLMVIKVIRPNVPLSFLSYAMSVTGLGISIYAIAHYSVVQTWKRRRERRDVNINGSKGR